MALYRRRVSEGIVTPLPSRKTNAAAIAVRLFPSRNACASEKSVSRSYVKQVSPSILINVSGVEYSAFEQESITQSICAAKTVDRDFVQPFYLLNGQEVWLTHSASFWSISACWVSTRFAASWNLASSIRRLS